MICTGFGPTSSAVGMLEPVTITRSASASGSASAGDGLAVCAQTSETGKRGSAALIASPMLVKSAAFLILDLCSPYKGISERLLHSFVSFYTIIPIAVGCPAKGVTRAQQGT